MQRWFLVLIPLLALTLAGCRADSGEQSRNTPEACRHEAIAALDRGDWDTAIGKLEDEQSCGAAFDSDERRINLAAAYAGKAGFDVNRIIEILGDSTARPEKTGKRLITVFARMRPGWDSMTNLERARLHYAGMMGSFAGGIHDACKEENRHLLSSLQKDACFYHGAVALVRAATSIALLLPDDLEYWLSGEPLSCERDRNDNGVLDSAEVAACALRAGYTMDDAGTCLPEINGHGAVTWQRSTGHEPLSFYSEGMVMASLVPIRVDIAASGQCSGLQVRQDYPLLQREGNRASPALTSGHCSSIDMARTAEGSAPDANRWPCPVLSADGSGAATLSKTLLQSLNEDAETLFALLPQDIRSRVYEKVNGFRAEICEEVRDAADACTLSASGRLVINEAAIADYLRDEIEALP